MIDRIQIKKELITFLVLTFATTLIIEFTVWGLFGISTLFMYSIFAMFIPAVVAIFCMYIFKSKALTGESKIFLIFFSIVTLISVILLISGTMQKYSIFMSIFNVIGFLVIFILNLKKKWRNNLQAAKLSLGKNLKYYLILLLIFSGIFIIGNILSYYFKLSLPVNEYNPRLFFSSLVLILPTFLLSWSLYFGEEYGWRFYLQDRLFAIFGGYKGVLLAGIIWALWHLPLMMNGLNFSNDSLLLGNLTYIIYTTLLSIIFGYAVLKTGSVWIAVLLHFLTDNLGNLGKSYIAWTSSSTLAFLPLLIILGIFALILLKSKVWEKDETLEKSVLIN